MISYRVPSVFQESACSLIPLLSCARDIQAPLPDPARCLWIRLEWCGGPCCHYRGEFMTSFSQLFSKRKLDFKKSSKFAHIWQRQRNRNPMTSEGFFFYNLIWLNSGGSCIPVISCLSVIHLKKNMPELFQTGQSVTWSIRVRWGETGKNLEQGLVVTKTGSE